MHIFTHLTSCGQIFIKLSYDRPCALIWGSLRTILKPYWRRLGVIFGRFWVYPRHLGQPKLHFEFNLGQLGPILASGKAPSCMGMRGADLQGALQSGPVALLSVPSPLARANLVQLGPCCWQLGAFGSELWPTAGLLLAFLNIVRLWAI